MTRILFALILAACNGGTSPAVAAKPAGDTVPCAEPIERTAHGLGCELARDHTFGSIRVPAGAHVRTRDGVLRFVMSDATITVDGLPLTQRAVTFDAAGDLECASGVHETCSHPAQPSDGSQRSLTAHEISWSIVVPAAATIQTAQLFSRQAAVDIELDNKVFLHIRKADEHTEPADQPGWTLERLERWNDGTAWVALWQLDGGGFTISGSVGELSLMNHYVMSRDDANHALRIARSLAPIR